MNWFIDIDDCCGCGACAQICPNGCITMSEDECGFFVPQKEASACINCGLCELVCPVFNKDKRPTRDAVYYISRNTNNDILEKSSSGGIFDVLSKFVLSQGGVVFGVRFNDKWEAIYDYAESLSDAEKFRGSKYLAARVGGAYRQTQDFLQSGRLVMFSGTPCHIAGLHQFLQKYYENLITVDVICHSVPSPKVWQTYLREMSHKKEVTHVNFRSKAFGWDRYGLKIEGQDKVFVHEPNDENLYMRGFLSGLTISTSCSHCSAKNNTSMSDVTIGDYWELPEQFPEMDDNRGMSLVVVSTAKGDKMIDAIKNIVFIRSIPVTKVDFQGEHSSLTQSATLHPNRSMFFNQLSIGSIKVSKALNYSLREHLSGKEKIVRILKILCGNSYYSLRRVWRRK